MTQYWIPLGIFLGILVGVGLTLFFTRRGRLAPQVNGENGWLSEVTGERDAAVSTPGVHSQATSLADGLHAPTGLQGTLAQVPLHDFLQFLEQGKRQGVLELVSGRRHGYLRFQNGCIHDCSFRGRYGLVALHAMLELKEGDYEFFEGADAVIPANAEVGPNQPPLEVVSVLLQWDAQVRPDAISGSKQKPA
jgi:hypothetical protein